jgi:hypothetical protein
MVILLLKTIVCLFVLFLFCQIKILQIWMPLGTIRKPLVSRGASRFIFIYQVGINNCQIALSIMGMNLGRFKSC